MTKGESFPAGGDRELKLADLRRALEVLKEYLRAHPDLKATPKESVQSLIARGEKIIQSGDASQAELLHQEADVFLKEHAPLTEGAVKLTRKERSSFESDIRVLTEIHDNFVTFANLQEKRYPAWHKRALKHAEILNESISLLKSKKGFKEGVGIKSLRKETKALLNEIAPGIRII